MPEMGRATKLGVKVVLSVLMVVYMGLVMREGMSMLLVCMVVKRLMVIGMVRRSGFDSASMKMLVASWKVGHLRLSCNK